MLNNFEDIPRKDRVIVALDCDAREAMAIAEQLQNLASWVKVGMTLYYAEGPSIVTALKDMGFHVFLDLKFHDIPHQVEGAAYSATLTGADMMTMHTVGGVDMMKAAQAGVEKAAQEASLEVPATLGITVLTSMNDAALAETGVSRAMADQVTVLAQQAKRSGISGVVASPKEAAKLREDLGPEAYIVTPGVRPAGAALGDQSRVATPTESFDAGASHIVIGRPITAAANPRDAFLAIAEELSA